MTEDANRPRPGKGTAARVYRFARGAFALFGLLTIIWFACFDLNQMVSPSMSPTLQGTSPENGDWVLTEKISYLFRSPHRWEVVRFVNNDGDTVMKRVCGLPGETIKIDGGRAVINDHALTPPDAIRFLRYFPVGPFAYNSKATACGDRYFVLGDDSRDSWDSRYEGPVSTSRMRGRPWLIIWPPRRMGWVNP